MLYKRLPEPEGDYDLVVTQSLYKLITPKKPFYVEIDRYNLSQDYINWINSQTKIKGYFINIPITDYGEVANWKNITTTANELIFYVTFKEDLTNEYTHLMSLTNKPILARSVISSTVFELLFNTTATTEKIHYSCNKLLKE